jgi:cytochrome c biogenesis protein CcmG, thiol:disulfide interchange protein DsbE
VWASWCVPCRNEHKILHLLKEKMPTLPLYGLNYKDTSAAAKQFLAEAGNPFNTVGFDSTGKSGIEWGVYGVPETYVLKTQTLTTDAPPHKAGDKVVFIHYKFIGALTQETLEKNLIPAIQSAQSVQPTQTPPSSTYFLTP